MHVGMNWDRAVRSFASEKTWCQITTKTIRKHRCYDLRQRPQTANGVVFVTLEDETGSVNVIVWKAGNERFRQEVYQSRLLAVYGQWQRDTESGGQVCHVIARRLEDLTPLLGQLPTRSRDFH